MARVKQLEFGGFKKPNASFGGSLLKGNPKEKRPLSSKLPILLTLRANQSGMRLPKNYGHVDNAVNRCARKYGVRIYRFANVGNHLHILIKVPRIAVWAGFIRELTCEIAAKLGNGKFWKYRPHTRIVQGWRKAYKIAYEYVELNILEAEGFINRKETRNLKELRAIFKDP